MSSYLDSNIIIYTALYSDHKNEKAFALFERIGKGADKAITSVLAVDEFIWVVSKHRGRDIALSLAKGIFRYPNLEILDVKSNDMLFAISLMEKYPHLKPRDAIHAAVAINNNADKIYSDDSDFDALKEIGRVGLS